MIIGDKTKFAVEILIENQEPSLKGFCRIWIENKPIGNFESKELLYPFVNSLYVDRQWLAKGAIPEIDLEKLSAKKEEIFHLLTDYPFYETKSNSVVRSNLPSVNSYSRIMFSASENFDMYIIRRFVYNKELIFLWEERKVPWRKSFYPEIEMAKTFIEEFNHVVLELEKYTNHRPQPYFKL
jgi:hypothetical protein